MQGGQILGPLPNLQLGQINPRLEFWVSYFGDTGFDGVIESIKSGLRIGNRHTLAINFGFQLLARIVSSVGHGFEDSGEPAGGEHLVLHGLDDQFIDLVHADGMAAACAFGGALGAGEVFVLPTLACAQHHAASAFLADGNAGQKRRASDDARGSLSGIAGLQGALDGVEGFLIDNEGHVHLDPLGWRALLPSPAVDAIVVVNADIGFILEDALDRGGVEGLAAVAIALGVEMGGDGLDAHGAAAFVSVKAQAEHHVDDVGLFLFDFEDFLFLAAQDQGDLGTIAERRGRAIPIAFLGIGHHHVADDAGIDLALVAIEGSEDRFHQFAMWPFRNVLGRGDQANPSLLQLFFVLEVLRDIAEKAAEGVDDDQVDLVRRIAGKFEHALELGAPVGTSGEARFDKGLHKIGIAQHAGRVNFLVLLFERDLMVGLTLGADAAIADSPKPVRRSLRFGLCSFCHRHHPLPGPAGHWPSAGRDRFRQRTLQARWRGRG
nr:hypothetical protein [Devosia sp.]